MKFSAVSFRVGKPAIVLSIILSLFSCKKISDLLTFSISDQSSFTVNSYSPVNSPIAIITPPVQTNSSKEFENNKTSAKLVKDIRLENLTLSTTSPSGQTFDFLQSIHIYISTNSTNEIEIAYLDSVQPGSDKISLIPTEAKLDEYIKSSSYTLRTEVTTKEILTHDVTINIDSKFQVTANL